MLLYAVKMMIQYSDKPLFLISTHTDSMGLNQDDGEVDEQEDVRASI